MVSRGETSLSVLLLTEELGTLYAHAQGVRALKSKLRSQLLEHSLVRISLVRGEIDWRVVGVEAIARLDRLPSAQRASLIRVLSLAAHSSFPDDPHTNYFSLIREAFDVLSIAPEELTPSLELLTVLKIISHAGFLAPDGDLGPFVTEPLSLERAEAFVPHLQPALFAANTALEHME